MAASLAVGLKWFVVRVIDSFMVILLANESGFVSSISYGASPFFSQALQGLANLSLAILGESIMSQHDVKADENACSSRFAFIESLFSEEFR
jgi:hypothetical protein